MNEVGTIPAFLGEGLCFALDVHDGWPPVAVEEIPHEKVSVGFRILTAPLFVRDLSVGDIVVVERDEKGYVTSWSHVSRSGHTTIWLLCLQQTSAIAGVLDDLREIGCDTVSATQLGICAVDVPPAIPIECVDTLLDGLNEEQIAVAFPSFRHDAQV
jgi:hypothetical protein